jgi:hypothetical protein
MHRFGEAYYCSWVGDCNSYNDAKIVERRSREISKSVEVDQKAKEIRKYKYFEKVLLD